MTNVPFRFVDFQPFINLKFKIMSDAAGAPKPEGLLFSRTIN